jgi:hypothetical protein
MSYGKLNIWIRQADCSLVTKYFCAYLAIKTCGGDFVADMDPTVMEKLKAKYEDYESVRVINYHGETRIELIPPDFSSINHVEVDVPPGCYVVWTTVCHAMNEQTNKVMSIVSCGDEACVNLLLDSVETRSKDLFHPLLECAVDKRLPKRDLQAAAKVLMDVANMPKTEVIGELNQRLEEVREMKDVHLEKAIGTLMKVVKGIPAPQ